MTLFATYLQDPLVLHLTRIVQTSDPSFIVDHNGPHFALGTLSPAVQKQNGSCFVFTSDVFISICRSDVRENKHRD
jgi:hypothetical protein